MWDRAWLKTCAKAQLKHYYWIAFAVCLVGGLLGGTGGGINLSGTSRQVAGTGYGGTAAVSPPPGFFLFMFWGVLIVAVLGLAFRIFVGNPISVGVSTWFIAAPRGYTNFSLLFSSFGNGRYKPIVKAMLLTNLYIWLWSLLFVIPGIVKSYQYRMVPYLISDHPYLTPDEAMFYSTQMTQGQKGEMFVLDLSFIGWYFLGALLLGIGVLFVAPYEQATWAQLYFAQRQRVAIHPPPDC